MARIFGDGAKAGAKAEPNPWKSFQFQIQRISALHLKGIQS